MSKKRLISWRLIFAIWGVNLAILGSAASMAARQNMVVLYFADSCTVETVPCIYRSAEGFPALKTSGKGYQMAYTFFVTIGKERTTIKMWAGDHKSGEAIDFQANELKAIETARWTSYFIYHEGQDRPILGCSGVELTAQDFQGLLAIQSAAQVSDSICH